MWLKEGKIGISGYEISTQYTKPKWYLQLVMILSKQFLQDFAALQSDTRKSESVWIFSVDERSISSCHVLRG